MSLPKMSMCNLRVVAEGEEVVSVRQEGEEKRGNEGRYGAERRIHVCAEEKKGRDEETRNEELAKERERESGRGRGG